MMVRIKTVYLTMLRLLTPLLGKNILHKLKVSQGHTSLFVLSLCLTGSSPRVPPASEQRDLRERGGHHSPL